MVLQELEQQILRMGALSERILALASRALVERDTELALSIDAEDLAIDRIDVDLDQAILYALALRAPVAEDLRCVMAIKGMAIDLERVGDLARNIARGAARLNEAAECGLPSRLEPLQREAAQQLHTSLDAFQARDAKLARRVISRDDYVDALHAEILHDMMATMSQRPEWVPQAVETILIAESLERVGDHATNIAEGVILIAEARIVKHAEKLS